MYDLHCHLLPGIDDGPTDVEHAIALCRQAVADGITHAVTTPHIHDGRWDNTKATIYGARDRMRELLAQEQIPLQLAAAAEVRVGIEVVHWVEQAQIPFLGSWQNQPVLLLEMHHGYILPGTQNLIRWLINNGIKPMIAHPERNKDIIRDYDKLKPFVEMGCLLQITAAAIAGGFGEGAKQCAHTMLKQGLVTIIASDAHHHQRRPAQLSTGLGAATQLIGEEEAVALATTNPRTISASLFN